MIEETVDCQHIGCFNRADVTFSRAVANHSTDGIGFIRGAVAQELQDGLCLCADNGSAFLLLGFLVRGIKSRSILDTRLHVFKIVHNGCFIKDW